MTTHASASRLTDPQPVSDPLSALLHEAVGLRLRERDLAPLRAWIQERRRVLGLDLDQWRALLDAPSDAGRREREELTVRLTVGETYFFRDKGQFELLTTRILPALAERRARERRLRIWSAGCSTGEEAWSLAMVLREQPSLFAGWDLQVIGTDINSSSLLHAREGVYGKWSFRSLDETRRRLHFRPEGSRMAVDAALRPLVSFRHVDLLQDSFGTAGLWDLDLIVCRNVFIYLEAAAIGRVVGKFAGALAEGGYLMTGHGELLGHGTPALHPRVFPQSVLWEKSAYEPALAPLAPHSEVRMALRPSVHVAEPPVAAPPVAPADGGGVESLMESAWRHADAGRGAESEDACRRALSQSPFDHWPYYLLAQLAQDRGDAQQARAMLNRALYLAPAFVPAWLELAALQEHEGESPRARQSLSNARRELARLPPEQTIAPYGASTVADLLAYVEGVLAGSVKPAEAATSWTK